METNLRSREEAGYPAAAAGETRTAKWQRRCSRLGWVIVAGGSALLFLLPGDYSGPAVSAETWLLLMALFLLTIWLGLFLGVLLLIAGHLAFFKRVEGVLLFASLMAICLRLWPLIAGSEAPANWLVRQLAFVATFWLFVLPFALGVVLLIYLVYRDKAVQATAVTLMLFIWTMLIYARYYGPEYLVREILMGGTPEQIWWFQTILCLTFWLLVLGPLSFLGHTVRLVYQELSVSDSN
jgi:hypothetical protein